MYGYLVYSSLLKTILDEAINDVDHFLKAQDGAFYIEDIHLRLDQWSKCVHKGRDCVVIWKKIVLFSKTDTKCSWSMFQKELISCLIHHYSNLFGDTVLS